MTQQITTDIVQALRQDHHKVEALLAQFESTPPNAREEYFCAVVTDLVPHEVAEEVVVYPAIRSDAPNGDNEANARIAEQSEAEELLAEMEKLDPAGTEFTTQFSKLRNAVVAHAKAEEAHIFPLLQSVESDERRAELGAKYEKAKSTAPTHPHPHAPDTPPGNKLLGPVAALFDKARDAARRS
jgi:hemerythrin superfamily protein